MNNALVVYDSVFGNTKLIAKAIADALSRDMNVQLLAVGDVQSENLKSLKLLLVGSPTRSFMATPACMTWIKQISPGVLKGVSAAAFDTRIPEEKLKSNKFLNFFSFMIAYAAKKISKALSKKGADIIANPTGFYVSDMEGPLVSGELERAAEWAKSLISD